MLLTEISPFGGSTLATREQLRQIVSDVAEFGLEIAKLPFEIWPKSNLPPGRKFDADTMQDVDPPVDWAISHWTTIIVSFPWVKGSYNEWGRRDYKTTYLNKARVSCISSLM